MRRAAKVDANQAEIVAALRRVGAMVQSLAAIGQGVPDLLVLWRNVLILMEVKDGSKPLSKRKLTPMEADFYEQWKDGPLFVVESVNDAINVLNGI